MTKYAIVDADSSLELQVFKEFTSLEELKTYENSNDIENDIIKIIDSSKEIAHGNILRYNEYFFEWLNLSTRLENGDIDNIEYNNSIRNLKQREKEQIKFILEELG